MSGYKLTDDEIIKAFESYHKIDSCCWGCTFLGRRECGGVDLLALDLLKRQKAEIDDLKKKYKVGS